MEARPKTTRLALGEFILALAELIDTLQIGEDLGNLAVNYDGRHQRLDIATLDAAGHLDRHLYGFDVALNNRETFGREIPLPQIGGVSH
jgi:hypothetical protein